MMSATPTRKRNGERPTDSASLIVDVPWRILIPVGQELVLLRIGARWCHEIRPLWLINETFRPTCIWRSEQRESGS
jgi:hypothetical protein